MPNYGAKRHNAARLMEAAQYRILRTAEAIAPLASDGALRDLVTVLATLLPR